MRDRDHPLERIGIQVLLFVLSLIVISWPIVAQSPAWKLSSLLGFLFSIWAIGIVMLFIVSRAGIQSQEEPPASAMTQGDDVQAELPENSDSEGDA